MKRPNFYILMLSLFVTFFICAGLYSSADQSQQSPKFKKPRLFAIKHVTILPMTVNDTVIENATIVISENKIQSINQVVPEGAEIINGGGKWLMPGLIDMHVHIPTDGHFNTNYPTRAATVFNNTQDIMTPFVTNGVTTVFDLNSRAGHFGQRNEILRGDVIGPRIALAAMIEGGAGEGRIVNTPEDGRQAVRSAKAEGYEFIKVYSKLNATTYKAIIEEANKQGMKVIGHIPNAFKGNIGDAFVPHFDMVAHAEEFFKQTEDGEQDLEHLAQLAKANGSWVCPTLIIVEAAAAQGRSIDYVKSSTRLQYVHPLLQSKWLTANNYNKNATSESIKRLERMIVFNKELIKALKKAEVPIVAGTDAGTSGVVWGFSLHDELELLVTAGLTTIEALHSATRLPASWLGLGDKIGTIETGKFADLVLLDANPLTDIKNTRKIAGVFNNGRWLDKKAINDLLVDLAKRNTETKHQWDWKNRSEY